MKKQLLIAAVAATMASASMADISITGAGMAKFVTTDTAGTGTDSHVTSQEMDLKVTGKHGDTTVVMAFDWMVLQVLQLATNTSQLQLVVFHLRLVISSVVSQL